MTLPHAFRGAMRVPAIAAPMFLVSGPELVVACCRAGVLGSFPALNQRSTAGFVAWLKEIGADENKLNPNGGAIALGHPLGGSGARIMTTLLYHMRDNNIRYGFQTMCEGGGQANATILELL